MPSRRCCRVKERRPHIIEKELCYEIAGGFYDSYNEMGPGFSEATYGNALDIALRDRGLHVSREHVVDVYFRQQLVGRHRLDRVVNGRVVIELKATERLSDSAFLQLRSYLSAARIPLGILLHYGASAKHYRVLAPWARELLKIEPPN